MNDLQLAWSMLISPSAAFAELRQRPRFWFPLLTLIAATLILLFWYFSVVDFEWYKENVLGAQLQNMPEQNRAFVLAAMKQKTTMWSSVIAGAISLPIVFVAQAAYYLLAGKVANVADSFKNWFIMICWSTMPALVGTFVSCIVLAVHGSNAQIDTGALQPLSLNELLFQLTPGQSGYSLLISLSVLSFWTWGLRIVGIRGWYNKSWTFSTVFALLPYLVVYSVWAWFAFR